MCKTILFLTAILHFPHLFWLASRLQKASKESPATSREIMETADPPFHKQQ